MAAVATFLNRNRWIELQRNPSDAAREDSVRWELDADGEFRTQLAGKDDVRAFTCGFVVRGFDVDEGLPSISASASPSPSCFGRRPSPPEVLRDRFADQHQRALPRVRARARDLLPGARRLPLRGRVGRRGRTAKSLTLASGLTSPALDDAVLTIPEVVRAVKRGDLSVKRHVPELPKPAVVATRPPHHDLARRGHPPDVKAKKNKRGAS